MADLEIGLISRAVMTGRVDELSSAGIEPSHFIDPEIRAVFETCVKHNRVWGVPLSIDALRRLHPAFLWELETNELDYLIREFADDRGLKFGEKTIMDMADMLAKSEEGHKD